MVVVLWLIWSAFTFFASQFLVAGLLVLLPVPADDGGVLATTIIEVAVYVVMLVMGIGLPFLFRKKLKLPRIRELLAIDRRPKLSDFTSGAKNLLIYYGILFAVMVPLMLALPDVMSEGQQIGFATTGNSTLELVLILLSLVVVAPIVEELLMRGLLFGRLREHLTFWPTAILVSLVFAAAHLQINVAIDTFILSMVACYAREKTGTIYPGVLIHVVKNGLAFALLFLL